MQRSSPKGRKRPLAHASLSTKIALGFAAVLVLHVSVAVLSHFGLDRAREDLGDFDQGRRMAVRMVEIDRLVGELERNVQAYTHTGHQSLGARIEATYDQLVFELDASRALTTPADAEKLGSMLGTLARYHDQFASARLDLARRRNLLDVELPERALEARSALASMVQEARLGGDERGVELGQLAQYEFEIAQNLVQSYVHRFDSAAIQEARERIDAALELLIRTEPPAPPFETGEPRERVLESLPAYRALTLALVQSTRGYLHLVKVVMAGEAQEFLYESSLMRQSHLERLDELLMKIERDQRRFQRRSLIISIITIALGMIASSAIGRSVVTPLRAITATLMRLASGSHSIEIPGRDRSDEIGDMAQAAQVFHERNQETKTLLEETRRMARRHEQVIADLEETNRDLDNFAYVASHDLKAPLRSIISLAEWIEEDSLGRLPQEAMAHLHALRQRTLRMGRLLEDLLAYSRAGRAELQVETFDVLEVAHDVVHLLAPPANIKIRIEGDRAQLNSARVAFEQVLTNLIGNSIKHHDRAHGSVSVDIAAEAAGVRLVVRDDGPGISAEYHDLIFEVFKTLRRRDEVEASGMGLAIVRKLIERYDATIEVDSGQGRRGASFIVTWPSLPHELSPQPPSPDLERSHATQSG